jgi:hypothetical protein
MNDMNAPPIPLALVKDRVERQSSPFDTEDDITSRRCSHKYIYLLSTCSTGRSASLALHAQCYSAYGHRCHTSGNRSNNEATSKVMEEVESLNHQLQLMSMLRAIEPCEEEGRKVLALRLLPRRNTMPIIQRRSVFETYKHICTGRRASEHPAK